MSRPKDRVARTLRRCLRALEDYRNLAEHGGWAEQEALEKLIKEVKQTIVYREL